MKESQISLWRCRRASLDNLSFRLDRFDNRDVRRCSASTTQDPGVEILGLCSDMPHVNGNLMAQTSGTSGISTLSLLLAPGNRK